MITEHFQNVIIGCGESGKYLSWHLASLGQPTVTIERAMIGGSCPNIACLPSKNVIFSAKAASLASPTEGLGVIKGPVAVDMAGVARRKRDMVAGLVQMHRAKFEATGAHLVMGEGRFVGPNTVQVTAESGECRLIRGDRLFINVGSRAAMPTIPGLAEARPMTHAGVLDLDRVPEHLVILGGGYVGLELAQAMRRFGSRVTIVHRGSRLLDQEDADVSDALLSLMSDEGIQVLLGTTVTNVQGRSGSNVRLQIRSGGAEQTLESTDLLVAVGRVPNTDRLDAGVAGVALDARGFVQVNDRLETTAPGIWAMGDCAGSPFFTHAGFDDYRVVRDNLAGGHRSTAGRIIPYCLFTDPELAHVGLNESQARQMRLDYRLAKMPMKMVARAHTVSQTRGFVKAIIGADDRVLGLTAFGVEASELVSVAQTAMIGLLPYTKLRDTIFTHPTVSEGLVTLFSSPPQYVDDQHRSA